MCASVPVLEQIPGSTAFQGSCCVRESQSAASYRIEIGEEAERRRAVDPERQEVLQLGMSLGLEGSSWQCQGAQEGVGLALGKGTYSRGGNKKDKNTSTSLTPKGSRGTKTGISC